LRPGPSWGWPWAVACTRQPFRPWYASTAVNPGAPSRASRWSPVLPAPWAGPCRPGWKPDGVGAVPAAGWAVAHLLLGLPLNAALPRHTPAATAGHPTERQRGRWRPAPAQRASQCGHRFGLGLGRGLCHRLVHQHRHGHPFAPPAATGRAGPGCRHQRRGAGGAGPGGGPAGRVRPAQTRSPAALGPLRGRSPSRGGTGFAAGRRAVAGRPRADVRGAARRRQWHPDDCQGHLATGLVRTPRLRRPPGPDHDAGALRAGPCTASVRPGIGTMGRRGAVDHRRTGAGFAGPSAGFARPTRHA
jgi:hypothetical protein